jgi:AraC-like DNA-binding protein
MAANHAYARLVPDSAPRRIVSRLALEIFEAGEAVQREWSYRSFQSDPFFRLYYAVKGTVTLQFAHGDSVLQPNHLYLLPANVPFRYVPREQFHHYWLHFCSPMLEQLPDFRQLRAVPCADLPNARGLMKQFVKLAGEHADNFETIMRLDIILRQLLTPFLAKASQPNDTGVLERLDLFSRVLDHIYQHLDKPLEIPELAALVKMTRGAFSAAFRQAFGLPPKHYVIQCRMDRAKILLVRTDAPIKKIASQVGYENEFFFYRIFKKYTGATPDEYRRQNNLCLFNGNLKRGNEAQFGMPKGRIIRYDSF